MLAVSWVGNVPAWLIVLGLLVVGWHVVRGQGGQALAILETTNRVLTDRLAAQERELGHSREQIHQLEARTSLEPILGAIVEQFSAHEQRSAERHQSQMHVLDLIAQRLGPDTEAA